MQEVPCACGSLTASLAQDRTFLDCAFGPERNLLCMAVCDGHGGDEASHTAIQYIPQVSGLASLASLRGRR